MGYFIGLPSELDVVEGVVSRLTDDGYDRDELDTVSSQDIDVDIEVYAEENDDIDVLERGTEDGETYLVLEPKTDDARALLSGETPPALEAEKPDGSNNTGGDNTMTEDYDDAPMTAAHAVAYESHKNLEEHEEVADDDLYNLDLDEQVALGTAAVMKGIEEDQYDDFGFVELDQFVDQYGEAFDDDAFKRYKGQMGGNQFDEDIPGNVGDEVDEINEIKQALGTDTVVWETLYREKAADNEESLEVIDGILDEVSRLDRDDSRLQSSRQGLHIAENTEKVQSQKADSIDNKSTNL